MIRSGDVDAVLIATPHYDHTTIGIDALNNGVHVLTEKPISVHKADAQRLIDAHLAHPELVFCAMFNQRTDPHYIKVKELIEAGELGTIQRTNWIITTWFRAIPTTARCGARLGQAKAAALLQPVPAPTGPLPVALRNALRNHGNRRNREVP